MSQGFDRTPGRSGRAPRAAERAGKVSVPAWAKRPRAPRSLRTCWAVACSVAAAAVLLPAQTRPLPRAHSHNDYERARPLLDALEHGFCSVEADIHLVEGQLLVAHDLPQVRPERTLQALYLEPLRERARQNGGRIFPEGPSLTLLIDIKSAAEPTYARLREALLAYTNLLTRFTPQTTETNAVTVIISGNRPRATMAAEAIRYAACDGRLEDLQSRTSPHFMPLISDNWRLHFTWRGIGALPDADRQKLAQVLAEARRRGHRVRFWGAPDHAAAWKELHAAGVDLINTDHLAELAKWLQNLDGRPPPLPGP